MPCRDTRQTVRVETRIFIRNVIRFCTQSKTFLSDELSAPQKKSTAIFGPTIDVVWTTRNKSGGTDEFQEELN